MKSIYFRLIQFSIILSILGFACSNYRKLDGSGKLSRYKGNEKQITIKGSQPLVSEGKILAGEWVSESKTWLDQNGNVLEHSIYNEDGSLFSKEIFKYDKRGKIVEAFIYQSDSILLNRYVQVFDRKGNKTRSFKYGSQGNLIKEAVFVHDKKGRLIEEYGLIGGIYPHQTNIYDKKGHLEEEKIISSPGVFNKNTYKHDKEGNITEEVHYNQNGTIDSKYTAEYDKSGNMISKVVYDADGTISFKMNYLFNTINQQVELNKYSSEGVPIFKGTNKYNDRGDFVITTYQYPDKPDKVYSYLREYDRHGNIVLEIRLNNGLPETYEIISIEYYD